MRSARYAAVLLGLLLTSASADAQQTLLSEDFNSSQTLVFPPAGWHTDELSTVPSGWNEAWLAFTGTTMAQLAQDAAGHEFTAVVGTQAESLLVSPPLDLSGYLSAKVSFDYEFAWINYMAHAPFPLGNGRSFLRASVDGGVTWSQLWQGLPTTVMPSGRANVDLTSLLGATSAELAWHYSGDYAHSWAVDTVRVEATPLSGGPQLAILGSCPGPGTLVGSGMTPGGVVALYFAHTPGSWVVSSGGCAGTVLPVAQPSALPPAPTVQADVGGSFSLPGTMQPIHCGVMVGAVDVATCVPSPLITL